MDGQIGGKLEAVEGAFAGAGDCLILLLAAGSSGGLFLAGNDGEKRIKAQRVVIGEVLMAGSDSENSLAKKLLNRVLDAGGVTSVGECEGGAGDDLETEIDLTDEKESGIGGDVTGLEISDHGTREEVLKLDLSLRTDCFHRMGSPWLE